MRIVFATKNGGKLKEIREIYAEVPCEIMSMSEAGVKADINENADSYAGNAMIKARAVAEYLRANGSAGDTIVMADDSGFEVDALNKEPGVYSARFMGEDTSYDIKNAAILEKVKDVPVELRTARFMCAIACVFPDGSEKTVEASYEGRVAYEAKGSNGFGYDPIFYVPEFGCTDAELSPEIKNRISHRAKALQAAKAAVLAYLGCCPGRNFQSAQPPTHSIDGWPKRLYEYRIIFEKFS